MLRYWEGLSIEQTAALLRVAPGTVKSQASRGLAALREHVAPRHGEVSTVDEDEGRALLAAYLPAAEPADDAR